jgi:hypothetical protein
MTKMRIRISIGCCLTKFNSNSHFDILNSSSQASTPAPSTSQPSTARANKWIMEAEFTSANGIQVCDMGRGRRRREGEEFCYVIDIVVSPVNLLSMVSVEIAAARLAADSVDSRAVARHEMMTAHR